MDRQYSPRKASQLFVAIAACFINLHGFAKGFSPTHYRTCTFELRRGFARQACNIFKRLGIDGVVSDNAVYLAGLLFADTHARIRTLIFHK